MPMKKIICLYLLLLIAMLPHSLYAQNEPLTVAVDHFMPPFIMQAGKNQLYGYDITMMKYICAEIERDCNFEVMNFKDLIPAVMNNDVDAAISSIGITIERAANVNFSMPYLPSNSQFLTRTSIAQTPFTPAILDNKSIGIEAGTIFRDEIIRMGVKNPRIREYSFEGDIIDALNNKNIDFALLGAPTSAYWQQQSSGLLQVYGPTMPYGFGLGIAVAIDNTELLEEINQALNKYLKSDTYRKNFRKYLETF